ncbi:NAD(P)H-hydrate dehydratase [Anaerohalosphaeraceae bacterium U12dextr]
MQKITAIPKLTPRPADGHKGLFGKILIVGGAVGFSGAAALAGRAALRSGAGLVRVAVPEPILPVVASLEPCYTTIPLAADVDGRIASEAAGVVLRQAGQNDVTAFGPGAGLAPGVSDVLGELMQMDNLRLVVDADGLNTLAGLGKSWVQKKKASMILTPHPGEMARLWKSLFRTAMPACRTEQAVAVADVTSSIVVLKGAGTVVTDGKQVYINTTGNPGMATAGAGDVLTGVIAALAGQGLNDFDAAVLGVYLHGLAGDIAVQDIGQVSLIATDLIEGLPKAFLKTERS